MFTATLKNLLELSISTLKDYKINNSLEKIFYKVKDNMIPISIFGINGYKSDNLTEKQINTRDLIYDEIICEIDRIEKDILNVNKEKFKILINLFKEIRDSKNLLTDLSFLKDRD